MLRWRLFGISFCIQPSFWLISALFGYLVVGMGMRMTGWDLLKYIGIWVLCTLVSVMVHELGHAVTGRVFGLPGNITLAGMGGQAVGNFETLRVWQRVLVILAGPGAGFLFLGVLTLINQNPWNRVFTIYFDLPMFKVPWNWDLLDHINTNLKVTPPYSEAMSFLCWMNLFWNIINLIPIMPLDGGMLMREGFTVVFPVRGLWLAFALSFLLAGGLAVYCILAIVRGQDNFPTFAIDPFFGIIMFAMMAVQNFTAMLQVKATPQRSDYYDREDD
jgi:stage IV sporulation protein FB